MIIMMMVATSPPAPPSVFCCVIAFIPGPDQPTSTRHHCWISSNVSGGPWFPRMTPMRPWKDHNALDIKKRCHLCTLHASGKESSEKIGVKLQQHLASGKSVTRRLSFIWNLIEQLDSKRICSWTGSTGTSLPKTKQTVEFPHGLPAWQHLSTQIGHLHYHDPLLKADLFSQRKNMELNKPIAFWMELCRNM